MPSRPSGFNKANCSVTAFPQSPPWATYRVYTRRSISTTQAFAMRIGSQPVSRGSAGGLVSERLDDLELLDGGARPPVGHDERQRVLMVGADVDEVDVHSVD